MNRRFLMVALFLALTMTACGGGGTSSDGAPPPTNFAPTEVKLADDVPTEARAQIVEVVTVGDSKAPGAPLTIRNEAGASQLIFATSADGRILAAGASDNGGILMSAESTAIAMLRLLQGPAFDHLTLAQVRSGLLATSAFPSLVAAVKEAWSDGKVPEENTAVGPALTQVLREVKDSPLDVEPRARLEQRAALPPPILEPNGKEPPYPLFNDRLGTNLVVYVDDKPGLGVRNATPLVWNTKSRTYDGRVLGIEQGIEVPRNNSLRVLLGSDSPHLVPSHGVPNDSGRGFVLIVEQTDETTAQNYEQIMFESLALLIDMLPIGDRKCARELTKQLVQKRAEAVKRNLGSMRSSIRSWTGPYRWLLSPAK